MRKRKKMQRNLTQMGAHINEPFLLIHKLDVLKTIFFVTNRWLKKTYTFEEIISYYEVCFITIKLFKTSRFITHNSDFIKL